MKKWNYALSVGLSFMLLGCMGSSSVVPTERHIVKLSDEKRYSVPVGTTYSNAAVSPKSIHFYKIMGVHNCKNGDITWQMPSVANRIKKIMNGGTKQEGISMYVDAAKRGEIGCSSPF